MWHSISHLMCIYSSAKWDTREETSSCCGNGTHSFSSSQYATHVLGRGIPSSCLLINNLPTPVLKLQSPYEILYKRSPNYNFFKVFGCAAFPYLRPYSHQKFNFHSTNVSSLAIVLSQKGYRCLHPSGKYMYLGMWCIQ
jgi:hypothetical protein